ncbi:WbuC family cupin fold metalloprotein [Geomonas nitrogeniifigens]|uniref:WbuC family cupin fold metalloprotein n=1 Tax=Geomonas diazotrophica TaxID=2843197 RepID=A0ABX8JPB6_9BACT|nr:WbuC family cupin fold metalloprotein [Geomonas nitrogeniifigens]QWV98936.1 WbuC family cupin fold metalloprotein [Geomonas nitrogeniifigens]QXE88084.1 WbuC family cupin fold metalloprotein [Geomonas nitrogeniifigens]
MKKLDFDDLTSLSSEAQQSPRKRMNRNLHSDLSDPVQRLAIAMEPDTYIRPHHHRQTWEILIPLRGRFVVLTFDDGGVVIERAVLGEGGFAVEIPAGGWHAVLSLDGGGVIFEVKCGPYAPFKEEDFSPWSPAADDDAYKELMRWFRDAEVGQRWPGCGEGGA